MNEEQELYEMIYSLALTQAWLNQSDNLKLTRIYRGQTKVELRKLESELRRNIDKFIIETFKADEETMQKCIDSIETITSDLATLSLEKVIFVSDLIKGVREGTIELESNESKSIHQHL